MNKKLFVGFTVAWLTFGVEAHGDGGQPKPTPKPNEDRWTGAFIGGHFGYAAGNANWTAASPGSVESGAFDFFTPYDAFKGTGSYVLGLQTGYNLKLPSGIVVGVVADVSAPSTIADTRTITSAAVGQASLEDKVELSGTVRGRLGFVHHNWLLYGTAGYAWSYDQFTRAQLAGTPAGGTAQPGTQETANAWRNGWAIGAGLEAPVAKNWTASLEYLFTSFGAHSVSFPTGAQTFQSDLNLHSIRLGMNYQLGDERSAERREIKAPSADNWALHGQITYLQQYAPPFRAPYVGTNSLISNQTRQTWDATFYLGFKLWPGAELWINPEIDQGFGLSNTFGVAGYVSGEAYKLGAVYPYARVPRAFIRQTFNLSGEAEKVEAGLNQFATTQTSNRVVLTVGKFNVTDIFDANKYAHDPRTDFFNWALIDAGSFDYASDAWGFTYGIAAEWYRGPWAFRAGFFDIPIEPGSTDLDPKFEQFQWVAEIERRYNVWGQPGKFAVTGFLTSGRMGRFADATQLATPGNPADIAAVRRFQSRAGIAFNLEQQINPNVGFFMRGGVSDGRFETYQFTDIDGTIAAGIVVSGKRWGRPDDTVGIAGVLNGISGPHVAFLNAGGLGILVGDGQLPNPGVEKIFETYYSFPLGSWRATFDYQFIDNPAYNRDRGPVSVIGTRLRSQF